MLVTLTIYLPGLISLNVNEPSEPVDVPEMGVPRLSEWSRIVTVAKSIGSEEFLLTTVPDMLPSANAAVDSIMIPAMAVIIPDFILSVWFGLQR
jgi:hypothetical protein